MDRYTDLRDVRRTEYLLRSTVTAALSIFVVIVAAYEVIGTGKYEGPFVNWAGVIVGVYFGHHFTANGSNIADRRGLGHTPPPAEKRGAEA